MRLFVETLLAPINFDTADGRKVSLTYSFDADSENPFTDEKFTVKVDDTEVGELEADTVLDHNVGYDRELEDYCYVFETSDLESLLKENNLL